MMTSKKETKAHRSGGFPAIVALLTTHVGRLKALDQWGPSCIFEYGSSRKVRRMPFEKGESRAPDPPELNPIDKKLHFA
jgi:hypothetical protein